MTHITYGEAGRAEARSTRSCRSANSAGASFTQIPVMKLSNALSLLPDLKFGISVAIIPTLKSILWNPTLLFRPRALSRVFMAHLWAIFGVGVDGNAKSVKEGLITPYAYGVVLDIGAGLCYLIDVNGR